MQLFDQKKPIKKLCKQEGRFDSIDLAGSAFFIKMDLNREPF